MEEAQNQQVFDTRKCGGKQCLSCATPESIKCKNCLAGDEPESACNKGCFGCQWTRRAA